MTWCKALEFARTTEGIAAILFGVLLSYIVELFPKWEGLDGKVKRFVILGLCLVLPVGALLAAWASACAEIPTGEDVWQAVLAGMLAFGASTFAHTRKME